MDGLNLGLGAPHDDLLPFKSLCSALLELGARNQVEALTYGPLQGSPNLRATVALEFGDYYRGLDAASFMLTHGASEAISLVARALLRPGDVVFVEAPTYKWALPDFIGQGARVAQVRCDEGGLIPEALEEAIARLEGGERARLLYTMPTFQNPTGTTMPQARRTSILDIASRSEMLILEDDAYFRLRYEGADAIPLVAQDEDGIVLHTSTFSKVVAPGIRLGWLCSRNRQLIERITKMRPNGANPLLSAAVNVHLRSPAFRGHLAEARRYYAASCELVMDGLALAKEAGIDVFRPAGGFYVWLRLPQRWSATAFSERCARQGVLLMNGDEFFGGVPLYPAVRIAISTLQHVQLRPAIERVLGLARAHAQEGVV